MLKLALPFALVLAAPALPAQEASTEDGSAAGGMAGMDHSAHGAAEGAMGGYMAAMDTMMQSMEGMEATGSPDADFLLMMIPHHRSAVDMARVELEQGQDEATRALAQQIIDSQEAEIAEMEAMLAAMGHPVE
jgi:uncharacterized protein (DUF305 family)